MKRLEINIPIPSAGINLIDSSLIADNEAAEGTVNFSFKDGIPQTRRGYVKNLSNQFTYEIKTIYNFISSGVRKIVVVTNGGMKVYNTSTQSFDSVTGTLASDYICAISYPYNFGGGDSFSDKMLILDGSKYYYFKIGGSLTEVPTYTPTTDESNKHGANVLSVTPNEIKQAQYICADGASFWVANKTKLYVSYLNRPDYFPANYGYTLSDICTGLTRFQNETMVFTKDSCTLFSGITGDINQQDTYSRKDLPAGYGCSQHRSIVLGNGALYWAGIHGIFRYRYLPSGFNIPEQISEIEYTSGGKQYRRSVKSLLGTITDWTKVYAVFFENTYRLCLGDARWLIFDAIGNSWAYYEYDKSFSHATTYDSRIYAVKNYIYELDFIDSNNYLSGLSDDGTAITFQIKSKYFDFSKAANMKKFKKIYFTLYSNLITYTLDFFANIDADTISEKNSIINKVSRWGDLEFGDIMTIKNKTVNYPIKLRHRGKRYLFQYQLNTDNLNEAFSITDINMKLKIKELK